jgi:hypothetical protein
MLKSLMVPRNDTALYFGWAREVEWASEQKHGAGDRDRTGDIQLGNLLSVSRFTKNQSLRAGVEGLKMALSASIEHNFEHNF